MTSRSVKHDARLASLRDSVAMLFGCVYTTLAAIVAAAFILYAVISFIGVRVLPFDAAAPLTVGRRRLSQPADGPASAVRPSMVAVAAPTAMPANRTFSETKV